MLLKFGELALKGRNRPRFVDALDRNLRRVTADLGPLEVRRRGGVFIVTGSVPHDELVRRCVALPGVSVVQPALRCERDPTAAADAAVELLRERPVRTFAVRARRRDKGFALRSIELAPLLGDVVRVRLGLESTCRTPTSSSSSRSTTRSCWSPWSGCAARAGCRSAPAVRRWCCCRAASTPRLRPTA